MPTLSNFFLELAQFEHLNVLLGLAATVLVSVVLFRLFPKSPKEPATDASWNPTGEATVQPPVRPCEEKGRRSLYLKMRDGILIAVDVYLPYTVEPGTQVPTVLYQTRYCRRVEFRWPLSSFIKSPSEKRAAIFVSRGYAFVAVDARGSGASFGHRASDLSQDEIDDGVEVADWIVGQPWSNGRIGLFGESYSGALAAWLLAKRHLAIQALAVTKSPFDLYLDAALPGGILWKDFNRKWGDFTRDLDRNRAGGILGRLLLRGTRPVDADLSGDLLRDAIQQHGGNYEYFSGLQHVNYRDDVLGEQTLEAISPISGGGQISASGVPVYGLTGWFDLFSARPVIALFRASRNPKSRLTIGPWPHEELQLSPGRPIRRSGFDWSSEILQFLDEHVNGNASPESCEPPVHYWTLAEEKWKSAATWPPPYSYTVDYYFSQDCSLDTELPHDDSGTDTYMVDRSAAEKAQTRWALDWKKYCRITAADTKLLHYDSDVLTCDLEITGHPVLTLFVESTSPDSYFFAYLMDIDPQGQVRCVTEGLFRALHRRAATDPGRAPYGDLVPAHSFLSTDSLPLRAGLPNEIRFDLLPVSYLFLARHRIRVAISGSGPAHFESLPGPAPVWRILRDHRHPSRLSLPVMPRMQGDTVMRTIRVAAVGEDVSVDHKLGVPK